MLFAGARRYMAEVSAKLTWQLYCGAAFPVVGRWSSYEGPVSLLQGTNGGVTLLGAAASVAGGLFVGTISYVVGAVSPSIFTKAILFEAAAAQWQLIPLGMYTATLCCLSVSTGAILRRSHHSCPRILAWAGDLENL